MSRHLRWFLGITVIAAALDQLTKQWALATLEPGLPVPVIDGYFDWVLAFNTGAAFSLLGENSLARIALPVIALIAVGALLWTQLSARSMPTIRAVALGLIAGGAVGNLIDRLHHGRVTDFVRWHYHDHMWPIFNVADAFLLVGAVAVIVDMARGPRPADSLAQTEPTQ